MRLPTVQEIERLPEEKRRKALDALQQLERLREENPLQFFHCCPTDCGIPGCRPHGKQHEFIQSRDRIKAFFAGNQAGKTTIGIVDSLIQTVDEEILPERLKPYKQYTAPFHCRVITPDATSTREVVLDKIREWVPRHQLRQSSFDKAYDKTHAVLAFANGSSWDFKTFEQSRDKHGGATKHRIHYDEEPPREIRNEARIRLVKHQGDELFTMTPLEGMTWMLDEVWDRRHEEGITAVQADMADNPWLAQAQIERVLEGLTTEERQARKEGRFVHFGGLVYPEWDDEIHLVDPPKPEVVRGWDTLVGIDPGIRGTGVVWVGFDSENVATVFDELFLTGEDAIPENVARKIRDKNQLWSDPDFYVIDPAAASRSVQTGESIESAYQRAGIFTVHGQNAVEAGVFEVKRRLQHRPALAYVSRTCTRLLWELARYRIDDRADGKFQVVKANDHELDALRYTLMARPYPWAQTPVEPRPARIGEAPRFRFNKPTPTPPTGALT